MNDLDKIKWASARIGFEKYKTEIIVDTHKLVADEPVDKGGEDLGPAPGDFLRISLASCTAITLRMYADRKGFDVKKIEVKVHTEEKNGTMVFHCDIQLTGSLGQDQRKRMLKIANACPVHKVLTNPIEIITQLV